MNSKILNIILVLFWLSLVIYIIIGIQRREEHLNTQVAYSIGEITEIKWGARVSPSFVFKFYIKKGDSYYIGKNFIDDQLKSKSDSLLNSYIGKKFLVKYSIIEPKFHEIRIDKPVPDSLYRCTHCHWTETPNWVKVSN